MRARKRGGVTELLGPDYVWLPTEPHDPRLATADWEPISNYQIQAAEADRLTRAEAEQAGLTTLARSAEELVLTACVAGAYPRAFLYARGDRHYRGNSGAFAQFLAERYGGAAQSWYYRVNTLLLENGQRVRELATRAEIVKGRGPSVIPEPRETELAP